MCVYFYKSLIFRLNTEWRLVQRRYPTDANASIAGATGTSTLQSSNIQLQSIPRRMYIYARIKNSDLLYTDTDTFLGITSISINWNNRSGLLSSATPYDLYNISKKNGCNLSWTEWSGGPNYVALGGTNTAYGTVGSVLCLEFGTDIGLQDLECPGIDGTYQLQMAVGVKNINQTRAITPTLYIVTVNEGKYLPMSSLKRWQVYFMVGNIIKLRENLINLNTKFVLENTLWLWIIFKEMVKTLILEIIRSQAIFFIYIEGSTTRW